MEKSLRVIILEDNPSDTDLLVRRLKNEGFVFSWVCVDREEDFRTALDAGCDVVLSDWSLPNFDGLGALKIVTARGAEIPFIIVSGSIGEEAAVQALRQGASDYILKDRPQRLGLAIRNALEQSKLRQEQKHQQELLRLQSSALNAAANAIVITDASGTIVWVNPAFTTLTGYEAHEAAGRKPRDLVRSGKHDAGFYQQMWQTILSGKVWRGQVTNRRKDGSFYTEEMTITPIQGASGQIEQFIGIKEDITQQKITQQILSTRLKLLELSAEQPAEELLQSALRFAEELTGSQVSYYHFLEPQKEIISLRTWSRRTLEERAAGILDPFQLSTIGRWADCIARRQAVVHNHGPSLILQGQPILARELVVPVFRNEQIVAILGVGNKETDYSETDVQILTQLADFSWDAIERKIANDAVRESENRFRQLAENMRDAFWLRDTQTLQILYANPAFETLWDIPREAIYQDSQLFLKKIHPDDSERVTKAQKEMWENGTPFQVNYRIVRENGSIRWMRARAYPVYDEQGNMIRFAGMAEDITEQHQARLATQQSAEELRFAYDATLQGWSNALELREHETAGHSQRVVGATLELARRMGMDEDQLVHIQRGALLHDIGKMGIPDSILLKPDPLTEEEWKVMRLHPVYAYNLFSPIPYLTPALDIPYGHHERWDGSGYPRGLKGEEIPLPARIFALVDVWDALSSDRPYRKAWSQERVFEYIQSQAGTHFDPQVVDVFLQWIQEGAEPAVISSVVEDLMQHSPA
ncbi:MAG: PAS domain S-box protein [Chloroflexi bacterium]|nr:PAS domain S-box protein [Chloroflexota bacterium]